MSVSQKQMLHKQQLMKQLNEYFVDYNAVRHIKNHEPYNPVLFKNHQMFLKQLEIAKGKGESDLHNSESIFKKNKQSWLHDSLHAKAVTRAVEKIIAKELSDLDKKEQNFLDDLNQIRSMHLQIINK